MEEQHHDRAAPLRWIPTDVSRGPQADRKLLDSTAEANAQQPRHGDAGAGLAPSTSVSVCMRECVSSAQAKDSACFSVSEDVWLAYQWLQSDLVPLNMPRFGPAGPSGCALMPLPQPCIFG